MGLRDNLSKDAAQSLGAHEAVTAPADATVRQAVALMQEHRTGCVIVVEQEKPTGLVTERDLLLKVLAKGRSLDTPIREVMSTPPVVIRDGFSVSQVIQTMNARGFRHMPMVDASGSLTGVVSVKRIVEYIVEHFPAAVFNLPPEPVQRQIAREGA